MVKINDLVFKHVKTMSKEDLRDMLPKGTIYEFHGYKREIGATLPYNNLLDADVVKLTQKGRYIGQATRRTIAYLILSEQAKVCLTV